jgi:hypothetical protein
VLIKISIAARDIGLSGCANEGISSLQDKVINGTSYTIGQAFDHRKACGSVKADLTH